MSELVVPPVPSLRGPGPGAPTLDDRVYDRLLRERIIFLGSVVEDTIANAICAQLLLLAAEDDTDLDDEDPEHPHEHSREAQHEPDVEA